MKEHRVYIVSLEQRIDCGLDRTGKGDFLSVSGLLIRELGISPEPQVASSRRIAVHK